jgi:hypothetical protein
MNPWRRVTTNSAASAKKKLFFCLCEQKGCIERLDAAEVVRPNQPPCARAKTSPLIAPLGLLATRLPQVFPIQVVALEIVVCGNLKNTLSP